MSGEMHADEGGYGTDRERPFSRWTGRATVPALLRGAGALVVVLSLSLFLLQGWEQGNDLHRYLLLLAQTGLMAAAGLACGHLLREANGARTFLTLAALAVPVNAAILGALLYSQLGTVPELPSLASWRAGDLGTVVRVALPALAGLGLVAWLGFLVLARRSAVGLTLLFMGLNALLLLPVRDSTSVALLLVVGVVVALWSVRRMAVVDGALRTFEGRIARGLPFVALLILAGRTLLLYDVGAVLLLGLAATAHLVLRFVAEELPPEGRLRGGVERASVLTALGGALALADLASGWAGRHGGHGDAGFLLVGSLAFAALLVELSLRSPRRADGYRLLAALVALAGTALNLLLVDGILATLLLLVTGGMVATYGYVARRRALFRMGGVAVVAVTARETLHLIGHFDFSGWWVLAIIGTAAILAASLVERHGAALRTRAGALRERWEA